MSAAASTTASDALARVLQRLPDARQVGPGQWEARCPAHDDRRSSLSIGVGEDGRVLLTCHAKCETAKVVHSLGLMMAELFPPRAARNGHAGQVGRRKTSGGQDTFISSAAAEACYGKLGTPAGRWEYRNAAGEHVGTVLRFDTAGGKEIRPVAKVGGGWTCKQMPAPRPLYRLPELLARAEMVIVVEGERCVDAAASVGLLATTSAGGAKAPTKTDWTPLAGRNVVILPDNDIPGRRYGETVANMLTALDPPARVRIVDLPGLSAGGDIVDWLADRSGAEAAELHTEILDLIEQAPDWEPPANGHSDAPALVLLPQDLTDLGNARRLVAKHGHNIHYSHPWQKWLVWDGTRWRTDDTGAIVRLAKSAIESWFLEIAEANDGDKEDIGRHAVASLRNERINAAVKLAASEPGIPVLPADLDKDPWLLNCPNGTLELRTGTLRPHDRADLLTKLCPTPFDPDASSDVWEQALERIFNGSQPLVEFWQRLCGYCLTGNVSEHVLPILHGSGSNGKSVVVAALLELLGADYAMQAAPDLLMAHKGETHPTDRADLFGKRLVATIETEDDRALAESLVKSLTGGDKIRARRMREDFWEFSPTHKILLATNHRPRIRGTDHAIWRRVALVPFGVRFWDVGKGESGPAELQADKQLPEKLRAELPGILAWCVRGCIDWQARGLDLPQEVRAATGEYRESQDVLAAFLAECCVQLPAAKVRASDLYAAYKVWSERTGEFTFSQRRFGQALTERGIHKYTSNGIWYEQLGLVV